MQQMPNDDVVFLHDRVPCMSALETWKLLTDKGIGFFGNSVWPGNSPGLNPTENLEAIVKQRVEENFLQFGRSYHQLSRRWKKLFCSNRWALKRHYNSTESPEVDEKASWCPSDQWWWLQQILKFLFFAIFSHFSIFNTHNQNIYLPKTKEMTDSAKTLVLLRKHSILNVYERGSIYLDHKQFYSGGF